MTTTEQERERKMGWQIHMMIDGKVEFVHDEAADNANVISRRCRIKNIVLKNPTPKKWTRADFERDRKNRRVSWMG